MRAALALLLAATTAASPTVDRTVRDGDLDENSGFVASARFPGVLWVIEDSGNDAALLAVGPDGRTQATVDVTGVGNRDWEALAPVTLPDGAPGLAIGEIGDNNLAYDSVQVVVVPEPTRLRDGDVDPVAELDLAYPVGPQNAEALLADPRDGRLYVVTKDLGGTIYAVPQRVWPDRQESSGTLERVADVTPTLVTDGAILPDGRVVLRNYGSVYVYPPVEDLPRDRVARATASARLPDQEQGESLAVVDGGAALLVGSEGRRQPVYRVPVPTATTATTAPPTDASAAPRPGPTSTAPAAVGEGGAGALPLVGLVLAALAAAAAGWGVSRRRRSRRPRG